MSDARATGSPAFRPLPRPRGLERVRVVREFILRPHECLLNLTRRYGDMVAVGFDALERIVLVSNAEYLEHIFHQNPKNYDKQTPRWQKLRQLWGNGLLTADGELWRRQRQRIQPVFHQECLRNFAAIAADETQKMAREWAASAAAGSPRDVYPDMLHIAIRTVTRAMFGADIEGQTERLIRAVGDTHDFVNPVSASNIFNLPTSVRRAIVPGYGRFLAALRTIHTIFDDIIRQRLEGGVSRPDMLGIMISATDGESSAVMSMEQLHDEMITMLMAGHETTGISTAWTWYWLSQRPDVLHSLQEELDRVLGGRPPAFEDLPQLPYVRMVFQESMRLTPSIWAIERHAKEEDVVGPYRIPAHATVVASPYVMHRDPRYWRNPEEFDPLRFLPEEEKKRPQYAYFPFGGGPRRCVGLRVGLLEGQIMIATLAQTFNVRLNPGHPVVPGPRVNMPPKFGLPMLLEPRRAPALAGA